MAEIAVDSAIIQNTVFSRADWQKYKEQCANNSAMSLNFEH